MTSASTTSTSYVTTLTGDATAISVTLATGTTALVHMTGQASNNTVASTNYLAISVSGATTLAAGNASYFGQSTASYSLGFSRVFILTGLTAGTNTFTLNYLTTGGTLTYQARNLVVQGIA